MSAPLDQYWTKVVSEDCWGIGNIDVPNVGKKKGFLLLVLTITMSQIQETTQRLKSLTSIYQKQEIISLQ